MKLKKQNRITSFDTRLFGSLYRAKRPLSIKKLANRTDMSWQTANIHVKKLEKLGVVGTKKSIRQTNVFIDPILFKSLMKKRKISS